MQHEISDTSGTGDESSQHIQQKSGPDDGDGKEDNSHMQDGTGSQTANHMTVESCSYLKLYR